MIMSKLEKNVGEAEPRVTLVFAYYENPSMLALQWQEISKYPEPIKKQIAVIVVDDGSPRHPAGGVEQPKNLPKFSIFRIGRDIRWNQDAARNIGAHESTSRWLLLTDIDHVVPAPSLQALLSEERDPSNIYSFARIKFLGGEKRSAHPNSYFMTKKLFWEIGGHDEDFAGIYGKDILFKKRALRRAREVHLENVPLARVGSTFLADAGTHTISRKNNMLRRIWGFILPGLKALKLWRGVQTLTESYVRVI